MLKIYVDTNIEPLDMFEDETISFTAKLNDIEKLSNVFSDFSQSFTVPASPLNNRILKYYYDTNYDNGYNGNIRIPCYLELNSVPFRYGALQIESSQLEFGEATNYKVSFKSAVTQLSELFKDDTINVLDYDSELVDGVYTLVKNRSIISQFDYEDSGANFGMSLNNTQFKDGNVITPLMMVGARDYNIKTADSTDITTSAGAIDTTDLRPALRLYNLIDAIEQKYDITFSRDFFGAAHFNNLFMWLNGYPSDNDKTGTWTKLSGFNSFTGTNTGSNFVDSDPNFHLTVRKYSIAPVLGQSSKRYIAYVRATFYSFIPTKMDFRVMGPDGTTVIGESLGINLPAGTNVPVYIRIHTSTSRNYNGLETMPLDFSLYVRSFDSINLSVTTQIKYYLIGQAFEESIVDVVSSSTTMTASQYIRIEEGLPKMKVLDFLQGIMRMYKLVIRPITTKDFRITNIETYYDEGNLLDFTDYVDSSTMTVAVPDIYTDIKFMYKKSDNILNKRYRETFDPFLQEMGYGDLKAEYKLDKKAELKVEVPFENMMFERLSTKSGTFSQIMIGQSSTLNEATSAVSKRDSGPIIFYNNGIIVDGNEFPVYFKYKNSPTVSYIYYYNINTSNDLVQDQITNTLNFGADIDPWHLVSLPQGLYNNYWSNWVETIYDLKQRKISVSGVVPQKYLEELSLNDRILIGDKRYKISDYNINFSNGKVKFNLFKDIYSFSDSLPALSRNKLTTPASGRYLGVMVNRSKWSAQKLDDGFGTDWIDITTPTGTTNPGELVMYVNEKAMQLPPEVYLDRTMRIRVYFDNGTNSSILIITQKGLIE